MKRALKITACLLTTGALATGCGSYSSISVGPEVSTSRGSRSLAPVAMITVTDASGKPVPNATLMIGQKQNDPFPGNLLKTDTSGKVLIPAAWTTPQPVTIEAKGFVRATYFGTSPKTAKFELSKALVSTATNEVKGETSGYANLANDGFIDLALIMPTVTRERASLLQLAGLVSPETDTMRVIGKSLEVPSNSSIPSQRETYVLPLTFSKPAYRIYFEEPGPQRIAAVHARFNLKELVDDMQNGTPFVDVINKFQFLGAGTKNVVVKNGTITANLEVNEVEFTPQVKVTAPDFDPSIAMVSVSLPEKDGLFYVSDVKRLQPREKLTLVAPKTLSPKSLVVSVLTKNTQSSTSEAAIGAESETLSAVTTPSNQSKEIEFLDLVNPPQLKSGTLVLDTPRRIKGVDPLITFGILSKVELVEKGSLKLEKKIPQWELYASDWATSLDLPDMPSSTKLEGQLRWEAIFAAQPSGQAKEARSPNALGPKALGKVTHVTRSAVDIQ